MSLRCLATLVSSVTGVNPAAWTRCDGVQIQDICISFCKDMFFFVVSGQVLDISV